MAESPIGRKRDGDAAHLRSLVALIWDHGHSFTPMARAVAKAVVMPSVCWPFCLLRSRKS